MSGQASASPQLHLPYMYCTCTRGLHPRPACTPDPAPRQPAFEPACTAACKCAATRESHRVPPWGPGRRRHHPGVRSTTAYTTVPIHTRLSATNTNQSPSSHDPRPIRYPAETLAPTPARSKSPYNTSDAREGKEDGFQAPTPPIPSRPLCPVDRFPQPHARRVSTRDKFGG